MRFENPDWLTFRGRQLQLWSFPLEPYLRTLPVQPDFRRRQSSQDRGYEASWEVETDCSLWLTGLRSQPDDDGPDPGMSLLFPMQQPVRADWVTLLLTCPDLASRRFSPFGSTSTYARWTHLTVRDGRVLMIEETKDGTGERLAGELTPHLEAIYGPEEAAFLRAAFDRPNDSAPRLVYADWLEERRDPRAGFVRLAEQLLRGGRLPMNNREAIVSGLRDWPWLRILGYHGLTEEPGPVREVL